MAEEEFTLTQLYMLLEDTNGRIKVIAEGVGGIAETVTEHTERLEHIEEKLQEIKDIKLVVGDHAKRIRVLERG